MKKYHLHCTQIIRIVVPSLLIFSLRSTTPAQSNTPYINDAAATARMATAVDSFSQKPSAANGFFRNNVKINATSLGLKNYHFTYERLLSRKISAAVGFRTMPMSVLDNLKFIKTGLEMAGQDKEDGIVADLNKISAANKALTVEFRFYGGHKPGAKGFYTGLFGRYSNFKVSYDYSYESSSGSTYHIPITANARAISGGLQLGAQFTIAKRLIVDMQLLGLHYGKINGRATGATDLSTLSAEEKTDLEQKIEDLSPSIGNKKLFTIDATAGNNGLTANMNGPFAGVRAGIHVGFAF